MKRDRLFGNAIMRFAACGVMAFVCLGSAWGDGLAPVNPALKKWEREQKIPVGTPLTKKQPSTRLMSSVVGDEDISTRYSLGAMPSLMDRSYLANLNVRTPYGLGGASSLSSKYDQRDNGNVTVVRDQGRYGTCWAHGAIGAIESCLLLNGRGEYDLSEKHMANTHGWDLSMSRGEGGWAEMAMAYLVRWSGPISEAEDPYPSNYYRDNGLEVPASPEGTPIGHVQSIISLSPMSSPAGTTLADTEEIKRSVMEYGSVRASYFNVWKAFSKDQKSFYWNGDTKLYTYDANGKLLDGGHVVLIVGWDDTYAKSNFIHTPPGDGAFLAKNSWGMEFGDEGYFYVSYYDAVFGRDELHAFPTLDEIDNYGEIYEYDPLGWVNTWGGQALTYWGANIFSARQNDILAAVGLYSVQPNTSYELYIYTGCLASKPESGTLAYSASGKVSYSGYATIPLEKDVPISKGQRFSVVLRLTTQSHPYPLAIEYATQYTSEASAASGQSFYRTDDGTWIDFTSKYSSMNFCCKAYTKSVTAAKRKLASIAVSFESGSASLAPGAKVQLKCEATYDNNAKSNVTDAAQWSLASGRDYATLSAKGLLTAKDVTVLEPQIITVRAIYSEDGITATNQYGFSLAATAPSAPTDVTATQGTEPSCVRVNWTAPNGATEYAVYRATANNSKNAQYLDKVTVPKFNDTTAVPGVDYWYFIKAKNSSGISSFSTGANGWRKLAPPESVTASDALLDRVALEWSEVEGAKYYRVYRAASFDGEKTALGNAWQTEKVFDDTTATAGATYYYFVVAAVDASGNRPSDYSIIEDGMRAVPVTIDRLEVKGDASVNAGAYADYAVDAIYTDGHKVENITPDSWTISGEGATVAGNRVTAALVTENKTVTLSASYTEGGNTVFGTKKITIAAVKPVAPTGVTVASASLQGVTLTWNAVADAASYVVYRDGGVIGRVAPNAPDGDAPATTYADATAIPGATYAYTVAAANGAGEGPQSSPAVTATVPLAAPIGVTATSDRTDGVLVSWQPVTGATHYRVARATSANGTKTELGSWTTGTSFLDSSAPVNTPLFYFVRAATDANGANASGWSSPVQGMRKPTRTLTSLEIVGAERVAASRSAVYSCVAHYNDGTSDSVSPTWSVSPAVAATIDSTGKLAAKAVTSDVEATVTASYGGKSGTKKVAILAPMVATATVSDVRVSSRWPFASLVDIDYTLDTAPDGVKATVALSGYDHDHNRDLAATTLTGDGAAGPIAAGRHRLTWNIGTDYPGLHVKAFDVSLEAVPATLAVPSGVTASSDSTAAVNLSWNAVEGATAYEIWRGTTADSASAVRIATVTDGTTYADTTAPAGATCHYWILAIADYGASEFADSVTGMRLKIVPTGLTISGVNAVSAGGTATYTCAVTRNDGTSGTVAAEWSIINGMSYATMSSGGVLTANGIATAQNVTIQARYTQNGTTVTASKIVAINTRSITITFNGNGGTVSPMSKSYTAYGTYGSLPSATRTGYTFAGWWTAANGGTQVTATSTVPATATTLYAHWMANTYTVTLDRQDGSGGTASVTATYDSAMPPITPPTRTGYTFGGYYTSPGGSGTQYYTASGASARAWDKTSAMTLYAYWKAPDLLYRIPSGRDWQSAVFLSDGTNAVAKSSFYEGEATYLYCCYGNMGNTSVISDYTILHKVFDSMGTLVHSVPCDCSGDLFHLNCGNVLIWNAVTFAIPTTLTAGTYTYQCILDSDGVVTELDEGNNIATVQFSIVKPTYTVMFNANGGTGTMQAQTFTKDAPGNLSVNSFTYSGYTFAGWATSPSGDVVYPPGALVNNLSVKNGDVVTLYAVWLGVPTEVSATDAASTNGVTITWTPVAHAASYQVWRGTSTSSSAATRIATDVTTTSYLDASASVNGTTYYYWVKAVVGSEVSPFSLYDSGRRLIAAPTGVNAVASSTVATNIVVTWNTVSGATSYKVYRGTENNPTRATLITTTTSRSYTDKVSFGTFDPTGDSMQDLLARLRGETIRSNRTYYYWVTALTSSDTSPYSGCSRLATYVIAGSTTFNIPKSCNYTIKIIGAGGGGAMCANSALNGNVQAGGGSGAGFNGVLTLASGSYTITVGAKGAGTNNGSAAVVSTGYNGGATLLKKGNTTIVSAGGGYGGSVSPYGSATGGSGGTLSTSGATIVSYAVKSNGRQGAAYNNAFASGGASLYDVYGGGGSSSADGVVGFFQITINE